MPYANNKDTALIGRYNMITQSLYMCYPPGHLRGNHVIWKGRCYHARVWCLSATLSVMSVKKYYMILGALIMAEFLWFGMIADYVSVKLIRNRGFEYVIIYNYWLLGHWTWCDVDHRVPILTEVSVVNNCFIMPPTSKKLWEHIGFELSVCACVRPSKTCLLGFWNFIYQLLWIPHGKIADPYFFLFQVISLSGVMPLWRNQNEIWCMPYLTNLAC